MTETAPTPAAATQLLFDAIGKILGIFAGLATIAYYIGWSYSRDYWHQFHAPWVLDLLSAGQMLADASKLTLPMVIGALGSLVHVFRGGKQKTLGLIFGGLALCGVATLLIGWIPESLLNIAITQLCSRLAAIFLMVSEGVGVGLLVMALQHSNLSVTRDMASHIQLSFVVIMALAPQFAAGASASIDTNGATSPLEVVTWPNKPDGDWRLGRAVDKGYIVIKLTRDPAVTEVRLIPYSAEVLIRPLNQPIM